MQTKDFLTWLYLLGFVLAHLCLLFANHIFSYFIIIISFNFYNIPQYGERNQHPYFQHSYYFKELLPWVFMCLVFSADSGCPKPFYHPKCFAYTVPHKFSRIIFTMTHCTNMELETGGGYWSYQKPYHQ